MHFSSYLSWAPAGLEPLTFSIPVAHQSLFYTTTLRGSVENYPLENHFYFTWLVNIPITMNYNSLTYLFKHVSRCTKTCIPCVGPWWIKRGEGVVVISFFLPIASHSQPQPKLRRPRHRFAHPAYWKYMVGSQTKYASYRNIQRSLRKLSTAMVVALALWRWSFWKHYQAYRRLVRSA